MSKMPKWAQVGDLLQVVDTFPSDWGYQFGIDPDTWLVPVELKAQGFTAKGEVTYVIVPKEDSTP